MDSTWLIYTALTVIYVMVLVIYFIRRSRTHEKELSHFLKSAQEQLENHKQQAETIANQKISKAMAVVKKVQLAALAFEEEAQKEYAKIIEEAKAERRELIAKAKVEIETLFKQADQELETYKLTRHREIEKDLVKLVVAVAQKATKKVLDEKKHKEIILESLDEIKQKYSQT